MTEANKKKSVKGSAEDLWCKIRDVYYRGASLDSEGATSMIVREIQLQRAQAEAEAREAKRALSVQEKTIRALRREISYYRELVVHMVGAAWFVSEKLLAKTTMSWFQEHARKALAERKREFDGRRKPRKEAQGEDCAVADGAGI